MRRNRLCVAIKSGRQGELPKGSMSLATSSTGDTCPLAPLACNFWKLSKLTCEGGSHFRMKQL